MPTFGYDVGDFSYSYSLSTKEATLTGYSGSSSHITIPTSFTVAETYKDEDGETHTRHHTITVTSIGSSAFANKTFITSVSFHNKLKSIGSSAFQGCTGLTNIKTPISITSMGSYIFKGCSSLIEAEINGASLSLHNSPGIFDSCGNLQRATFGDGVTRLYSSYLCEAYGANTRSGTFGNNPNLQRVSLGVGITEVPTHFMTGCGNSDYGISASFKGQISRVYNNAFNNSNITNLNITLANCAVDAYAFSGCPAAMDGIDFTQVKSIGERAFSGCSGLTSVRTSALLTSLSSYAFYGCGSLVDAEINGTGLSLYNSPGVFENCPNLHSATFGDGVIRLYSSYLCEAYGANTRSGTFGNNPNLQRVSVGASITEVPPHFTTKCGNSTNGVSVSFGGQISRVYNNAFNNGNITNLNITLANCAVDSYAFSGCPAAMDGIDFTQIKSIGERAFSGCSRLTSVKTSILLTSLGSYAFSGCNSLVEVDINGTELSLYNAPGIFENCSNLRRATFGDGVTRLYGSNFSESYGYNPRSGTFGFGPTLQCVAIGSGVVEVPPHFMTGCGNPNDGVSVSFGGQISRVYNNAFNNGSITNLNITLVNCVVDSYAFSGCPAAMDGIDFTQIRSIGERAFSGCSGLTSVKTSELLTSLGTSAFLGCTSLVEAEINGTGLDLYYASYLFKSCTNLRRVVFGDGVTRLYPSRDYYYQNGTRYISGMFGFCSKLQSVSIGSGVSDVPEYFMFDVGNAEDKLSVTFSGYISRVGCYAINNGNVTNLNVMFASGTVDSYAFSDCPAVTLDSVNFAQIITIGDRGFQNCRNIFGCLELLSAKSIGQYAFSGCTAITSVRTSESLTSLGSCAFLGCASLVTAEINGTSLNLERSLGLFRSCGNLRCVVFGDGVIRLYPSRDSYYQNGTHYISGMFGFCSKLQSVSIGSGVSDVPEYFMFDVGNAEDKLSISFGGQIGRVGYYAINNGNVTNLSMTLANCVIDSYAFSCCPASLDNLDFTQIKSIGERAFSGCIGLTFVRTSRLLTSIGQYAFYDCSSLVEAEIDGTNLSLERSAGLFKNCRNLRGVKFGDGVTRLYPSRDSYYQNGTHYISGMFGFCSNLQSVSIGSGVSDVPEYFMFDVGNAEDKLFVSFGGQIGRVGYYALNNSNITNMNITLVNCAVDSYAFSGCSAVTLKSVDFSQVKSTGERAFQNCRNIIGDMSLSLATSIGQHAFSGCTGLASAKFGSSLTSIGQYAFSGCTNASSFAFASAPPSVGSSVFSNVKKGARGYYTAVNAAAWEAVIDSKGYWNGLKMKPSYYTVIYDANNGTGARTTATVERGEPTPAGDGTFTWEAHYFMGWAFEDVGGSTLGSDDVIPEPQEGNTVTLYGQWATFEPVAADWSTGSITLKATGVNLKEGEVFFLSYCDASAAESDGVRWDYVEDYVSTSDESGVSFTDTQFSSRLGGIPAVRYRLEIGESKDDVRARLYCTTRNRFGIVVGLGKYDKAKYGPRAPTELAQCRNDAKLFEEVMRNEGGIESVNMFALYDSEGTVENVSKKWKTVANQAVPGDTVFFCMGTHGGSTPMTSGGGLLTAYDGRYLASCLQRDLEPFKSGGRCDGAKVVLILPNCHSEAMVWPYQSAVSSGNILYVTAAAIDEVGITFEGNNPSAYTEFGLFFVKLGLAQHQADEQKTLSGVEGAIFGNQDGAVDLLECAKYSAALDLGKSDMSPAHVQYDSDRAKMMANTILVSGNRQERIVAPDRPNFGENIYLNKVEQGIRINANRCQGVEYLLVRCYAKNEGEYDGTHFQCFIGADIFKTNEFASDDYRRSYSTLQNNVEYCFEAIAVGAGGFSDPDFGYATTENESIKRIISFDANGGTVSETEREVLRGSAIGNLPTPTNGDYQWLGWFKRDGNGNWCEVDANTIVVDSEVYYARWKELELYHTVGFDANGAPVSFAPILVRAWEPVGDLPEPQWEGHTFVGWFSKYGGHGTQLNAYSMVGRDQIYYAYWTTMPVTYLNSHNVIATASNGDIATAAAMTAANGCRTVGECYALGIDPEDPNDDLKIADFKIEDGKPVITLNHTKDGSGNSFEPRIKTLGKMSLSDADWIEITDKDQSAYRFFKVTVDLP